MYSNITIIDTSSLVPEVYDYISKLKAKQSGLSLDELVNVWFVGNVIRLNDFVIIPTRLTNLATSFPAQFFFSDHELEKRFYARMKEPLHPATNAGFHDPCVIEMLHNGVLVKFYK